jgi:hypothetical protein
MGDLGSVLWNQFVPEDYEEPRDKYVAAIMEQYKLYVEMMDRVSARRGLANTFFLTLNSVIVTIIGIFWRNQPQDAPSWALIPFLIIVLGQCLAWRWLIQSYVSLNNAKLTVIGTLEERLPASPYWRAEWKALGDQTEDWQKYKPILRWEQLTPIYFALAYLFAFVLLALSR